MAKAPTRVIVDEEILRAVRIRAARTGTADSQVIEESLRRDLGLDELPRHWGRLKALSEKESLDLAYAELHEMRRENGAAAGGP
jgi:hypothetical protein